MCRQASTVAVNSVTILFFPAFAQVVAQFIFAGIVAGVIKSGALYFIGQKFQIDKIAFKLMSVLIVLAVI
jgi:hypothetical protein